MRTATEAKIWSLTHTISYYPQLAIDKCEDFGSEFADQSHLTVRTGTAPYTVALLNDSSFSSHCRGDICIPLEQHFVLA